MKLSRDSKGKITRHVKIEGGIKDGLFTTKLKQLDLYDE